MTVRIVTDSSCDLPASLVEELGIEIVPLTVRIGAEEFVDRRDLTPQEFWARSAASPTLPETAAPSPGSFEAAYRKLQSAGAESVVAVCLSAGLSATYQSAELAARSVDGLDVRAIDSRSLTMGLGHMARTAAQMAREGRSPDEIVAAVRDLIGRTRVYAVLDTLENLKKGGRIGGAAAMVGSMLSIKPVIQVRDGEVHEESKQRTRSKSLRYLADKVRQAGAIENLAVMHGDAPDIDEFLDLVSDVYPRRETVVGDIGAVIGAHAGPRVVGVTFCVPPG